MKQNIFERFPRLSLLIINSIFLSILFIILNLNLLSDSQNKEKYSIYDQVRYSLQCQGKRNIVMRENRPNSLKFKKSPYEIDKKYRFSVDENGFINPSKIHENPDLTLVFLGGSTTECETVEEELRFPYLAGKLIAEKSGKKVNSYNGGKSGNNSIHSVNNLLNKAAPLQPDYVIWMENINDLSTLLYEATFWNRNKTRSNLGCFSKKISNLRKHSNEWSLSPYRSKINEPQHQKLIKSEFEKIIKIFINTTRAIGAKPILMTQFNRIENDPNFLVENSNPEFSSSYKHLYQDFNQIIRQIAAKEKILLIDLAVKIPRQKEFIYDNVHITNEGSKMVSEVIASEFNKILK